MFSLIKVYKKGRTLIQTNKQTDYVGLIRTVAFMYFKLIILSYIPKGYSNIEIYVLSLVIKYIIILIYNILLLNCKLYHSE